MNKKNLLLVDDDTCFRFAMATELRADGFVVQCAEDGNRAIRMMENDGDEHNNCIDLIITDLVMPRRDGFRFSTEVRKKYQNVPILVITGFLFEDAEKELGRLGRIDFLEKPFTPVELLSKVKGMLSESKQSKN